MTAKVAVKSVVSWIVLSVIGLNTEGVTVPGAQLPARMFRFRPRFVRVVAIRLLIDWSW